MCPMCRLPIVLLLCLATVSAAAAGDDNAFIGRVVEEFELKDYRGKSHALADVHESKLVVIAFLGTECPLAKLYSPRLVALAEKYGPQGVAFIGVNANRQDSMTEIAAHARDHKIPFPVLKDVGNRLADRMGALRTPEVFVLDQDRRIQYCGRIDDQYGIGTIRKEPTRHDLAAALDELLAAEPVSQPLTKAVGCYIGRIREPKADGEVTYSHQIARLFQDRCVECHRPGEIAPFALTSYEETVGWAETIAEVVAEERMPPWHASPDHGKFVNDRRLSDDEKQLIARWVADGAPEGNPDDLPEPRQFLDGWQLPQEPDLVVHMREEPYTVQAEGVVRYQYFFVDPGFTEDKWVKAAEVLPGNRAVVHHVLVAVMPPGGRRSFADAGEFLTAYVPGLRVRPLPEGMAKRIPAGSKLIFQVHYTPIGTVQKDRSKVGFVFADPAEVKQVVVTTKAQTRNLAIPPHEANYRVEATSKSHTADVWLLSFSPHMHLRGKSFRYEAVFPDGTRETLLDVPRYDFNWQTSYRLVEPRRLPAGTRIHCVAQFDNSAGNLANPDPAATVRWGDQTWNEMMIGYFDVAIPLKPAESE